MQRPTLPRRPRPLPAAALALALTATLLAACGSGAAAAPTGDTGPGQPTEQATGGGSSAPAPQPSTGGTTAAAPLAALVPGEKVRAALGETPSPACDTSVLTGGVSCTWTATDGAWLKVEDGTPQEMPDLESFTQRVTGTLGLREPVTGLGEAAYLGKSSRGTRIAVFMGEGRVVWVVLNKPGDVAGLVTEIATVVTAGL